MANGASVRVDGDNNIGSEALPNSLMDSNVSLNKKQEKSKELGHAP
jgi:hypothetical protein